jgi:DNA-binding HxlR family transcriptional regulator
MERLEFSTENCSVARALEILGEKWTLLVLREAFYGVRRFDDMAEGLGCARNILSSRLATLVEQDILRREPYREDGQRERFEYRLTPKGKEIFPILVALLRWGDRWCADAAGPPVEILHAGCGAPVRAELRCDAGHGPLTARDTTPVPTKAARRKRR